MSVPEIDLTVYPDECDTFGHLNQAAFLSLFERARWEMLARGPGMEVFGRGQCWPAVRRTVIDYHAPAFPGDVLRFQQALIHRGRTSFTMRQTARRVADDKLIAAAEFLFVCIGPEGGPVAVPEMFAHFMAARTSAHGEGHRVTVNGVSLAFEEQGEGPAVLFIHGYPLNRTIWAHQMAQLSGFRRIAPDLRGMGLSDAPDLGYSMGTYADDLIALLDVLGVDRAVVCGLSMGGYVALELLRRYRERIRALILMDTRAEPDSADEKRARDTAAALAREAGAAAIAEAMLPKLFAPATQRSNPEAVELVRRLMESMPVAGIVGALTAMRDRSDSTPLLPSLQDLPTLVVGGEQDQLTPPARIRRMAEGIPGARLIVIPGAGHLPPVEQPAVTTRILAEFLRSLA